MRPSPAAAQQAVAADQQQLGSFGPRDPNNLLTRHFTDSPFSIV